MQGNLGGIIAPFLFLPSESPLYHVGYGVNLGSLSLGVMACFLYVVAVIHQNRKLENLDAITAANEKMDEDDRVYKLML